MKTIYLIRHSGPFVKLHNTEKMEFEEFSKNMILSSKAEEKAKELTKIEELKDLDEIYSSNSARAIATIKYLSEQNNLPIKVDNRINERKFGVTYIEELPEKFIETQFKDKEYKLENGESLNEVNKRFSSLIEEILNSNHQKVALSIHGIALMSYLSTIADVNFYNDIFKVKFNNKIIMEGLLKNPDVYKITYDENKNILDIENII